MKKILLSLILALVVVNSWAWYDVEIDGIYYNLVSDTKSAKVTSGDTKYSGSIVIPSSIDYDGVTYSVTSIGSAAFNGCINLTSVNIPDSVTIIDSYAFNKCSNLTSINIPNSVTIIYNSAFAGCSSLTSITIPNSVTKIDFYAFQGCFFTESNITNNSSCKMDGVTIIDEEQNDGLLFKNGYTVGCRGWATSVSIPNSCKSIGSHVFAYCPFLTSVIIPNSVTSIGSYAFSGCSKLTEITIPNSVTSIGTSAFEWCDSIKTFTCYATEVPKMGNDVFYPSNVDKATLVVPEESLEAYKSAKQWKKFGTFQGMDKTQTVIKDIKTTPLLISQNAGIVTISGIQDCNAITAYSIDGEKVASAEVEGTSATLDLNKLQGSVAVLTVGGKSTKVLVK